MELRQLRYFKTVADARSFARGAQDLRVAQPALSRSVAKLEDEIGHSLFIRHSAGVSLTDAGARFYDYATRVLGSVRELVEGMAADEGVLQGVVAFGAPQSILSKLALPVAAGFLSSHPQCRVDLVQNSSSRLRDQVAEGSLDLAIVSDFVTETGMHFTPLLRESICLICRQGDRGRFGETVALEDLLALPLIVSGYPHSLRLHIDRQFPSQRDAVNVRSEVNSSAMVAELVMRGVGFGVAPYCVIAQRAEHELDYIPIRDLTITWTIATNWHRQGLRAVAELEAEIVRHARALIESGDWPTAEAGG